MAEKNIRRHGRIPYTGSVRISWQDPGGMARYAMAKCLDVSEGGLRIQSIDPVPARTIILLNDERLKISGSATVKHVVRRGSKYLLGVELNAALLERTLALAKQAAERDHPTPAA